MKPINILVTGVGSTTAISVIKGLELQKEYKVRIVGTDIYPEMLIAGSSFCDAFYQVPLASDPFFVSTLLDICQREHINLIIPIVDPELVPLAVHRDDFLKIGATVLISGSGTIRTCNDKYLTHGFFIENGIPTPKSWIADQIESAEILEYPLFVKPRDGVSSRNAFLVQSPHELKSAMEKIPNLLIQESLSGEEYTIDVMADFEGKIFAVVPRKRMETRLGISYKGITVNSPELIQWGRQIAEKLPIIGPANIQCMVSEHSISFFEINPRFSGSLPLTIHAGVNSPLWALHLLRGIKPPDNLIPFQDGLIMTRYWAEIFHSTR